LRKSVPAICSWLSVRCGSIWGCRSLAPRARLITIAVWRSITLILPSTGIRANIRTPGRECVSPIYAIGHSFPFCEILDDSCQFLLEHLDTLLDHCIWFKVSGTLNLKIKARGDCVIVKSFTLLWRIFPCSIFAFGPCIYVNDVSLQGNVLIAHHSFCGSSS